MSTFIIAEIGVNHNGDLNLALKMIKEAKNCGADAVKFQTFKTENFVNDKNLTYTYKSQGKEITEPQIRLRASLSVVEVNRINVSLGAHNQFMIHQAAIV